MGGFDPLGEHLLGVAPETKEITLSLSDIERIIGGPLPATAYVGRRWWKNAVGGVRSRCWLKVGWKVSRIALADQQISFVRGGLAPRVPNEGYDALRHFFERLPAAQTQIALRFSDIEAILSCPLPMTAHGYESWWANSPKSPASHHHSWMRAGWRTKLVLLGIQLVVFERKASDPLTHIPTVVRTLLEGTGHVGLPDSVTLIGWIRLCKQLGWYFEGSVLYERCGSVLKDADDVGAAVAQEDYEVCKRELTRHERRNGAST